MHLRSISCFPLLLFCVPRIWIFVRKKASECYTHWRKSGGGGMYPPTFWVGGGGWPVQIYPPTFEDKNIYCKEIELFNCKTIKNSKNRSLAPLDRI